MIRRQIFNSSIANLRFYSDSVPNGIDKAFATKDVKKTGPNPEATQIAIQSAKDMWSIFSVNGSDSETQPIDTKPIFQHPEKFATLSMLHQGQVLKELQEKYEKDWNKLSLEDKKLGYYIYYGNWGVREAFVNWDTLEPPYDLPFTVPSKLSSTNPAKDSIIKPITPPVVLADTKVRQKQFNTKGVDGVTRFFIYLAIGFALGALYRDKNIGEAGKPVEVSFEDEYERNKQGNKAKDDLLEESKAGRKWYYLWLK